MSVPSQTTPLGYSAKFYLAIALLVLGLSACGQKGPLKLPEPEQETEPKSAQQN